MNSLVGLSIERMEPTPKPVLIVLAGKVEFNGQQSDTDTQLSLTGGRMKKYTLKREEPKKVCFFCDKRHYKHSPDADEWILNNSFLCNTCKETLRARVGKPIEQPVREPGEEG